MAIETDPQRIGVQPSGRMIREFRTDLPSPNMSGVQKFAESLSSIGEMAAKQQAEEDVKSALAAAPSKDGNGNYMVPPAPETFGPFARRMFDDAVETRYKNNVFQDFQTTLNRVAAENQNDPDTAFALMEGHMRGTLKGMDPRIAKDLEANFMREVNERHRGVLNLATSREREATVGDLRVQRDSMLSQAQDAHSRGLTSEAERLEQEAAGITQRLVGLKAESVLNPAQVQEIQRGNREAGRILSAMNKAIEDGTITPEQLNFLHLASQGLGGDRTITVGDMTISGNQVLELIKDPRIRTVLGTRIKQATGDLLPNFERDNAAAAINTINTLADRGVRSFPLNTSGEQQTQAMLSWVQQQRAKGNNIDPSTPEGFNIIFQRYGAIPKDYYKKLFEGVNTESAEALERLRPLYQAMENTLTSTGQRRSLAGEVLPQRDDAIMYWYSLARGPGGTKGYEPTAAAEFAVKAVNRGLEKFRTDRPENFVVRSYQEAQGDPKANNLKVFDQIKGQVGFDIAKMDDDARQALMASIGLFAATGLPFKEAVNRGALHFNSNYEVNKFTLQSGLSGKNGPTPKALNPPELPDQDGNVSYDYLKPLAKFAIKEMASTTQPNFKVPVDQLELGKNLWLKPTGADSANPSFQLWYFEKGGTQVPVLDNNGRIVTMYIGKYIQAQSAASNDASINREVIRRGAIEELNRAGATDPMTGMVITEPSAVTPNVGQVTQQRTPAFIEPRPEHIMPPPLIRQMLERPVSPLEPDRVNRGRTPRNQPLGQRTGSLSGDATVQPTSFGATSKNVIESASNWLGINERSGRQALASFFQKTIGESVDPVQTAWCAVFVNAVLRESGYAGISGNSSKMARTFLAYGERADKPSEGDIVVLQRGSDQRTGHVGFFMGYETRGGQQYVKVLGGNQADSVNVTTFPVSQILGIRRPMKLERMAELPGFEGTLFSQWNDAIEDYA
jgi:uncharacterized protein (TIGR02594 family)